MVILVLGIRLTFTLVRAQTVASSAWRRVMQATGTTTIRVEIIGKYVPKCGEQ